MINYYIKQMWTLNDSKQGVKKVQKIPASEYFPKIKQKEQKKIQIQGDYDFKNQTFVGITPQNLQSRKFPNVTSPIMTQPQFFQESEGSYENSIFVNDLKKKHQLPLHDFSTSFAGLESLKSRFLKNNTTLPALNSKLRHSKYSNQFSKSFINDHMRSRQSNLALSQRQTIDIDYRKSNSVTPIQQQLGSKTAHESPKIDKHKFNYQPKDFHKKINEKLMNLALDHISQKNDGSKSPFFNLEPFQKESQEASQSKEPLHIFEDQTFKSYSIAAQHHSRIKQVPKEVAEPSKKSQITLESAPRVSSALKKLEEYQPPPDEFYLADINLYEAKPPNITASQQEKVRAMIQFVDQQAKQKKQQQMQSRRMFQDPSLFEADSDDEKQVEMKKYGKKLEVQTDEIQKEPSMLKIEKLRIRKKFQQAIQDKMDEIKTLHEKTGVMEDLDLGSSDEQEKEKPLLGVLMNEFSQKMKAKKILNQLEKELKSLIAQKLQEEQKIKMKIQMLKVNNSPKFSVASKSPKDLQFQETINNKISASIFKAKKASIKSDSKVAKNEDESPTKFMSPYKKKKKNMFQYYVRKHVLKKNKGTLNIKFLARVVNMMEKMEIIFPENINLGRKYYEIGSNLWKNDYLSNLKQYFSEQGIKDFQMNLNQTDLKQIDENLIFSEADQKMNFYKQAKSGKILDQNNQEANMNQQYFDRCQQLMEKPLPAFAKFNQNCLFLSEFRISDNMAEALKSYLIFTKNDPKRQVKKLYIDDCGMRDHQLAEILTGIASQGTIRQLIYSNNEFGPESTQKIIQLMPKLREFQLSNLTRGSNKILIDQILKSVIQDGLQLQKLKLSHVQLNDQEIVTSLCNIIFEKQFITHLDLSWCGLSPNYLLRLSTALKENLMNLRNLNLSYNSLYFDETNRDLQKSEEFLENFTEFLESTKMLNHLDISGMNFGKEELKAVCATLSQSDSLIAVHLSDNGLRSDPEIMSEVLDMFGIGEDALKDVYEIEFDQNRRCGDGKKGHEIDKLKNIVKNFTGTVDLQEVKRESKNVNETSYKKHIVQVKQVKTIGNQKLINQSQVMQGIGRIETNLVDQFVLSRKLNEPELIFNQFTYKDEYFQEDDLWQLSKGNECHVCQKFRYTMIFYDQLLSNEGLIEIKDKAIVDNIKDELNFTFHEADEIAPVVCGTVVNGGFFRKLRMLRADLFTMLSVCQSGSIISHKKQTNAIKKGIEQFVLTNQKILQQDALDFMKGWEKVILDKACHNQLTDVQTINMPSGYEIPKKPDERGRVPPDPECTTFVYSAYIKPGLHQFIIYCPVSKRAFVKDIIVDLNGQDFYPEFPAKLEPPVQNLEVVQPKRTRANVWRKWRDPKEKDLDEAFKLDISIDFDPSLFLKDPEDASNCKEVLQFHFDIIRTVHKELLAKSPETFPEIGQLAFLQTILGIQSTPEMKRLLPQAAVENAFIRATRGDDGIGTLCRGEFMEILLRLVSCQYPKQIIANKFQTFVEEYMVPIHAQSTFLKDRKAIHSNKQLNQLLYDNLVGLQRLYKQYKKEALGFTLESAQKMFAPLSQSPSDPLSANSLFKPFVHCQMFNKKDLVNAQQYLHLREVEYLELICRVAMNLFKDKEDMTIPEKVYELMVKIWDNKNKKQPPPPDGAKKKRRRKKKFPALKPLIDEEDDSD